MVKSNNKEMNEYITEYSRRTIDLENEKSKIIIKNCGLLIILNALLLIPLIVSFIKLLEYENIRLFTIIFGFTLIGLLIVSIVLALSGCIFNKKIYTRSSRLLIENIKQKDIDKEDHFLNKKIDDLDSIYLRMNRNNVISKRFLISSFIVNCSTYIVLIGAIITIMIFM